MDQNTNEEKLAPPAKAPAPIEFPAPAPIEEIAKSAGLLDGELELYGKFKAKVLPQAMERLAGKADGKLILVTAINPTPAGEGKTTTSIGLADALRLRGRNAALALREPSMGPVFGVKGGATGGGLARLLPSDDINLHFTGDIHAVGAANNLLAAIVDNHLFYGNRLNIDPRAITWRRCIDMNDRQLRAIVSGLSGKANGVPREDGFDITAASEVMAIFCLSRDFAHLRENLRRIAVARNMDGGFVTAGDLQADGAMAALLAGAFNPNLVQTAGRTPALVHGGPFANIAHGCNSVAATKLALKLADIAVTEAGFGADLGAEKFCDIKCGVAGIAPAACVIVVSARALKHHGAARNAAPAPEDIQSLDRGLPNLYKHIKNMRDVFGVPVVVAVNRFTEDTDGELAFIVDKCVKSGVAAVISDVWARGGEGGLALAQAVEQIIDGSPDSGGLRGGGPGGGGLRGDNQKSGAPGFKAAYEPHMPIRKKIEAVATKIYGADGVDFMPEAKKEAVQLDKQGFGALPVCIAKTQYSLSDDPKKTGAPSGHRLTVRALKLCAGAGFVVALTGDIMTMPGLPRRPAAEAIDAGPCGKITGI